MGTVLKIAGLAVGAFVVYRVVVAVSAGASVKQALLHPTTNTNTLAAVAAGERRANQGAGHF